MFLTCFSKGRSSARDAVVKNCSYEFSTWRDISLAPLLFDQISILFRLKNLRNFSSLRQEVGKNIKKNSGIRTGRKLGFSRPRPRPRFQFIININN